MVRQAAALCSAISLVAVMMAGCAQATTGPPDGSQISAETMTAASSPTPQPTATDTYSIPTLDPQYRTPTLTARLPYWSPSSSDLATTRADSLGAPLPLGAVTRIGLGKLTAIALSPDAQHLVVGTEAQIVVLRSETFELLWAVHVPKLVRGIVWSPEGEQIVAWLEHDQRAMFLNPRSGGLLHVRTYPEFPADMAWSPDASLLASISEDGTALVWRIP